MAAKGQEHAISQPDTQGEKEPGLDSAAAPLVDLSWVSTGLLRVDGLWNQALRWCTVSAR